MPRTTTTPCIDYVRHRMLRPMTGTNRRWVSAHGGADSPCTATRHDPETRDGFATSEHLVRLVYGALAARCTHLPMSGRTDDLD
jgi:hypothetical protein